MRVVITGGTGLVGSRLQAALRARGDEIILLSRRPEAAKDIKDAGVRVITADPMLAGPWMGAVAEADAVVNLAGANLFARRWNAEYKEEIVKSRVETTKNVAVALKAAPRRADDSPKVLVSASAIGIYGPHESEELDESSPPGDDFLARACVQWENAAQEAETSGVRVVRLRTGVVLDPKGGALAQMLTPFKMFVGGPVGSGRQYMSWIHHADLVGLILLALDRATVSGPLNGTAPQPVTNREFSKALGRALHRPSVLPTPGFMLRLVLGEVADVVTKGQRVLPRKAFELGYAFKFSDIDAALVDVVGTT